MKKISLLAAAIIMIIASGNAISREAATDDNLAVKIEVAENIDGKTISAINIKTKRIYPQIVRRRFLLKEGDIFTQEKYAEAQQNLHDMRIFKTLDFTLSVSTEDTVTINIDAEDGFFVFPFLMATGGASEGLSLFVLENNLFKFGEFAMVMGAVSGDNYMAGYMFAIKKNFFSISVKNMDYTQSVYEDESFSNSSFFSNSSDDTNKKLLTDYTVLEKSWQAGWSRSLFENLSAQASYEYRDIEYPASDGLHNIANIGLSYSDGLRGADGGGLGGIGAIFGMGMSDAKTRFEPLKSMRFGYMLSSNYANGGAWTASQYYISKFYAQTRMSLELKDRNIAGAYLSYGKMLKGSNYDKLTSSEILQRGNYSTEFRGDIAVAMGVNFIFNTFKTKTGFLVLTPFIENAILYDDFASKQITGAGIGASYTFWKFPIPFGIKYTQTLENNDFDISFMFGGSF